MAKITCNYVLRYIYTQVCKPIKFAVQVTVWTDGQMCVKPLPMPSLGR